MSKATCRRRKATTAEDHTSHQLPKDLSKSTAGASGPDQASPCGSPMVVHELEKSAECQAIDLVEPSDIGGERCRPNLNQPPSQPCEPQAQPAPLEQPKETCTPTKKVLGASSPASPDHGCLASTSVLSPESQKKACLAADASKDDTLIKRSPGCAKSGVSVLGKRSMRDSSPGMEAYKRIKTCAAQLQEGGPTVLTPAIFQKTLLQPPSLLSLNKSDLPGTEHQPTGRAPAPEKSQAPQNKPKPQGRNQRGALSYREFDRNVCGDGVSIQVNSIKCLENYLDLTSLTYFGTDTAPIKLKSQPAPRAQLTLPAQP